MSSQLSNVLDRSLFRSLPNRNSALIRDEKEMILEQNFDVLVPKYIGTISFVFHFLEQIQRADRGATTAPDSLKPVIYLQIGSTESRDSHSQKPISPPDKRVRPTQNFSSFPLQNSLLRSWNVRSFVTRQFHGK